MNKNYKNLKQPKNLKNSTFYLLLSTFLLIFLLSTFYFLLSSVWAAGESKSKGAGGKGGGPIDAVYHWAWNDVIGWIDFYSTGNVNVSSQQLSGYASTSVGFIALDCTTSPNPPADCATTYPNWKITNDGNGKLSGWAWNDAIGWISFDCHNTDPTCAVSVYQVTIGGNGFFSGWAWNDIIGWISFNCDNSGTAGCDPGSGGSDYKVKTSWQATATTAYLISAIFDTQTMGGAAPNAILWQGQLNGGVVKFQIASSNCSNGAANPPTCDSGAWSYLGSNGTEVDYYETGPNTPIKINLANHNNQRYFRYKVILISNTEQTASPKVEDVIINWSP